MLTVRLVKISKIVSVRLVKISEIVSVRWSRSLR